MTNVAVVGAQWGDEGKGKIVDWLCDRADMVVRFQGGHNAGHTLVIDGKVYKLALLPSGVVRQNKMAVIGNGVVVDPWALFEEIARVEALGLKITPENLRVADNATLILPLHRDLDGYREDSNKGIKIGTTRRGIGPAYEDKVGRRAIRVCDLADPEALEQKVEGLLTHHNALRRGLGRDEIDGADLVKALKEIAPKLLPFADRAWRLIEEARQQGKRILYEGAQAFLLDVDHGTYPFVTSSNTVAAQAAIGCGSGLRAVGYVLGIAKAYTTRVGEGPFPTELHDDVGRGLLDRGREYGTNTGRPRRCGWFDAVLVRQAVTISGIDGIALTKLDVLDGLKEVKICIGYRMGDQTLDYFPAGMGDQAKVEPIFETLPGWSQSTQGARSFAQLPAEAIKYVTRVEELVGAPVALLSTSPERDDTILMRDPFRD